MAREMCHSNIRHLRSCVQELYGPQKLGSPKNSIGLNLLKWSISDSSGFSSHVLPSTLPFKNSIQPLPCARCWWLELHCEVGPAKHQKMTELDRPSICWNVFVNLHQIDLTNCRAGLKWLHSPAITLDLIATQFLTHLSLQSIIQHLTAYNHRGKTYETRAPSKYFCSGDLKTSQRPHRHSPFRMPLPQMELFAFGRPYHAGMCQAGSGSETLQRKS